MSTYTTKYPKSYWDPNFLDYIGLDPNSTYYKNHVLKCIIIKLNKDILYGRYELDDELQDLIKTKMNINYIWRYSSKNGLNNILSYFKSTQPVKSTSIYTIDFNENGNNIEEVFI